MATTRSQFVIKRYDSFGGNFIDSQYLGNAYETGKPHVFENTLMKVWSSETYFWKGKILLGMTGAKQDGVKEIDTEIYRWKLQGAQYKCMRIIEDVEPANTAKGLNGTSFLIKGDQDFYAAPDVFLPEDPDFPMRILEGPIQDGVGYVYKVRLEGDNRSAFLPSDFIAPGKEFSKSWTSVASEYNEEFGTQQYTNSFMLESQVSAFAQKVTVTDKAWRDEGKLGVDFLYTDPKTGKSKKISKFLPYAEGMMHDELAQGIEAQMLYGKRSTKPGHKGYWVKTGPGIREQLRDGHTEYYNGPLTTNIIKDYLLSIFFSREDETNRKVVAMTGTLGALMFHDMLATEAASFLTLDTHFIEKISSNPRHLSFGAQFTHYQGPEGIEMTLIKNPMYDSRRYCKRMHPIWTDIPIDSARFTFLDFGSSGGEKNIQMLKVKDTFRWGYTVGTVGPNGPVRGGQAGALIAGYDMFTEGTGGIWIKDVTRTGELIYDADF